MLVGVYRYGFNGQEKSDEIKGEGNSYTAQFWEYDPRIGRRWNTDPIVDPQISSYAVLENNPILLTDPNGDCATCPKQAKVGQYYSTDSEVGGETPQGGFVFTGKNSHTQWVNIGKEDAAHWVISYFSRDGDKHGYSWSDQAAWYSGNGQEYKQSIVFNLTDRLMKSAGKGTAEAFGNIYNGEPFKDTREAFSRYDDGGGVVGFAWSGIKSGAVNWWSDLRAGGHRTGDGLFSAWQFSAGMAKSHLMTSGFSLAENYMSNSLMSKFIKELELGTSKYPGTKMVRLITDNHLNALAQNLKLSITKTFPTATTIKAIQNQVDNPRWRYIDLLPGGRQTLMSELSKYPGVKFNY